MVVKGPIQKKKKKKKVNELYLDLSVLLKDTLPEERQGSGIELKVSGENVLCWPCGLGWAPVPG